MMDRRTFISSLALAMVALPLRIYAQQTAKIYRIGILWAGTAAQNASRREAFLQGLRDLGWVDHRTITFEERWANGQYDRLPALAAELVALKVDLIMANNGTPSALAAMAATREIPVVAPAVGDPVASKLAQSLAHPGGNLTGSTNMATDLYAKRLALVKEAMPRLSHAALLLNGENPFSPEAQRLSQAAGQSLGMQIDTFDVRNPKDFEDAFDKLSRVGAQAVVASTDILFQTGAAQQQLGELALRHRLPLMAGFAEYRALGVLLAYSADNEDLYRRSAVYVDKILRGAKPGDLPIEQPARFKLVIDLRTANALGLTIPQSLLSRADEVIQ